MTKPTWSDRVRANIAIMTAIMTLGTEDTTPTPDEPEPMDEWERKNAVTSSMDRVPMPLNRKQRRAAGARGRRGK